MRDDARPKCEGATSSTPFDTIHLNTIATVGRTSIHFLATPECDVWKLGGGRCGEWRLVRVMTWP